MTQEKVFVSRMGTSSIGSVSLSENYYSVVFGDNSIRVCRADNNKAVVNKSHLVLGADDELHVVKDKIAVVSGTKVQFKGF